MGKEEIPDHVRRFVLTSIPSVPFAEGLLLLRSSPEIPWSPRQIAGRLYVPEAVARELLDSLIQSGFARPLGETGAVRYAADPALDQRVSELEHWYSARLVDLTALIHSKVDKRAQQFADAFRWRKER